MKKLMALFLQVITCFALIATTTTTTTTTTHATAAENKITVIINGENVAFTEDSGFPYVDENYRTMVPLRITMEAAGASVGYDPVAQTAIVVMEHNRIEVPIGVDYLYNNNAKIQNDTVAVAKNNRTYLPIRAVLEAAGYIVEWNSNTNSVIAYNFTFDENTLTPYSTSSIETLIKNLLLGNVVYINGQYYATPDYVRSLKNVQIHYLGDDLNTAIYPQQSRFDPANMTISYEVKEWVTLLDLSGLNIDFQVLDYGDSFSRKGFYSLGIVSKTLYEMPSLPDNFLSAPYSGVFDGIQIKVENGELLFKQSDLIAFGILTEEITGPLTLPTAKAGGILGSLTVACKQVSHGLHER